MLQLLGDLNQYERFKREDQPLEMVHLRLRTLIRDLAAALREDPDRRELQDHLMRLQDELAELERRAPWITADYPVEMALWGSGAGLL